MLTDPVFVLVAVIAILLAGVSKGGFGSGAAFAATPLVALMVRVPQAAAIMLPILCAMDLVGIITYWRKWDVQNARALMIACVPGVGIGALLFGMVDDQMLKLLLGLLALSFLVFQLLRRATVIRVQRRDRGQQRLGVGMARVLEQLPGWGGLNQPAQIHNRDVVADLGDDTEVMRDE